MKKKLLYETVPWPCSNEQYESLMAETCAKAPLRTVCHQGATGSLAVSADVVTPLEAIVFAIPAGMLGLLGSMARASHGLRA